MAVQLLLVLLLQTKEDLHGACTRGHFACLGHDNLRSVLKNMGGDILSSDTVLGNAFLVATHQVEDLEGTLVDLGATIRDNADHDLFPAIWSPHLRAGSATKVGNVLDNCVHRPDKENFVFVVHSQDDEELSLAPIEIWSQGILLAHKLVGVTCGGSIAHLGKLLTLFRGRDNVGWHLHIEHKVTILERDLPDGLETSEVSTNSLVAIRTEEWWGREAGRSLREPRTEPAGTHTPLHELVSRRTKSASDAGCSVVRGSEAYLRLLHGRIVDHLLGIRHLRDWRGIVVLGIEVLGGVS